MFDEYVSKAKCQVYFIENTNVDYQKRIDAIKQIRKECEEAMKRIINVRLKAMRNGPRTNLG